MTADKKHLRGVRTVWWEEDADGAAVCLLDQSLLPHEVVYLRLRHAHEVADAIKTLKVRGAPVIGVTAAFGMALPLCAMVRERQWRELTPRVTLAEALGRLQAAGDLLRAARPTAVNLPWAIERMLRRADAASASGCALPQLAQILKEEAAAVADEDFAACIQMGRYGAELIADGDVLLTHCNAGALATSGWGSGLAPVYAARDQGKRVHVFVDETRPMLQGARLTAWELQQEGIPLTLITDNMAAHFMRHGGIRSVFVGADRIAANGDVANKIGTYGVAVLARAHEIPLYVVAPRSTIDLQLASGAAIPIEQRSPDEVTTLRGVPVAPGGVPVANPAFDVTPYAYVSAIITEAGVAYPPFAVSLRELCDNCVEVKKG